MLKYPYTIVLDVVDMSCCVSSEQGAVQVDKVEPFQYRGISSVLAGARQGGLGKGVFTRSRRGRQDTKLGREAIVCNQITVVIAYASLSHQSSYHIVIRMYQHFKNNAHLDP